jgi:hypothetical protein
VYKLSGDITVKIGKEPPGDIDDFRVIPPGRYIIEFGLKFGYFRPGINHRF